VWLQQPKKLQQFSEREFAGFFRGAVYVSLF
jgi:hypothetical protein